MNFPLISSDGSIPDHSRIKPQFNNDCFTFLERKKGDRMNLQSHSIPPNFMTNDIAEVLVDKLHQLATLDERTEKKRSQLQRELDTLDELSVLDAELARCQQPKRCLQSPSFPFPSYIWGTGARLYLRRVMPCVRECLSPSDRLLMEFPLYVRHGSQDEASTSSSTSSLSFSNVVTSGIS